MENTEFYAYPGEKPLQFSIAARGGLVVSPEDRAVLERDWQERGYTRSSVLGTLVDTYYRPGEVQLAYALTEYKMYSGLAFPALPQTEGFLSQQLRDSMRASAVGCVVETLDGKILAQRRKEGLSTGGMIDSGAAGMMLYNAGKGAFDWRNDTEEKLKRELNISDLSSVESLVPRAVFSSRGPVHIPAPKGYFIGCYSGMVSSLALVTLEYGQIRDSFAKDEVGDIIGIDKKDLAAFIVEHARGNRGLNGDGCAALLATLSPQEFHATVERLNSQGPHRIRFGSLVQGVFKEQS